MVSFVIPARNTLRITPVALSLRGVSAAQERRSNPTTRGDTTRSCASEVVPGSSAIPHEQLDSVGRARRRESALRPCRANGSATGIIRRPSLWHGAASAFVARASHPRGDPLATEPPPHDGRATADASPAKRFFIYMLVKDIELVPSVVDLVDNSVDAARARLGAASASTTAAVPDDGRQAIDAMAEQAAARPDMSEFWIHVTATPDRFEIRDNGGGIPLDTAERYAFRFGRPEDFPGSPLAVGQFGVGMKRALFKLGTRFKVSSISDGSRFELPVDVDEWARDLDSRWQFVFSEADRDYAPAPTDVLGTTIEVDRLHDSVSEDFGSRSVLGRLRLDLELRHQSALESGLTVTHQ